MERTEADPRRGGRRTSGRLPVPPPAFAVAQYLRTFGALARGLATRPPHACPCCGVTARFLPVGVPPRMSARCPSCGSLERHRLLALALARGLVELDAARVLHIAPEDPIRRLVEPAAGEYRTADRAMSRVDHRVDLQHLALPDGAFDVVICTHVLEHVPDDGLAMRELRRVLTPGGVLVAMVPVVAEWAETYEPSDVVTPAGHVAHFGQSDHVRWYGNDFPDRLRAAGFTVEAFVAGAVDSVTCSLVRGDRVFLARAAS